MLAIMESFQPGSGTCRVESNVAASQLDLLAAEEARSEDELQQQTYDLVKAFYQAGPDAWGEKGMFRHTVQQLALPAFEEIFQQHRGRPPQQKEIEDILGITDHYLKKWGWKPRK